MLLFLLLDIVVIPVKLIIQIFTKGTHCLSTKLYIGRFEKFSPKKSDICCMKTVECGPKFFYSEMKMNINLSGQIDSVVEGVGSSISDLV